MYKSSVAFVFVLLMLAVVMSAIVPAQAQTPQFFMVFSNDCKAVAVYSRVVGPWRTSFIFEDAAGHQLATYNAPVAGVGISVGVFSVPVPGSYLMRVMRNDVTPQQLIETDTATCAGGASIRAATHAPPSGIPYSPPTS